MYKVKQTKMNSSRWQQDVKGIGGLHYILFKNVPMRESQLGPVIEINEVILEGLAARAIIEHRLPIRGVEVKFFRKVLGFSMDEFSEKLGLTSGAIFKWEQKFNERLHPINEIAVRSLVADRLNLEISGRFSQMISSDSTPRELVLHAG